MTPAGPDSRRPLVLIVDDLPRKSRCSRMPWARATFTSAGRLRLHCERARPDKVLLHMAVADTGIGMTQDQSERLFQPFTQVDASLGACARPSRAGSLPLPAAR